jgi:hypothetical protein
VLFFIAALTGSIFFAWGFWIRHWQSPNQTAYHAATPKTADRPHVQSKPA